GSSRAMYLSPGPTDWSAGTQKPITSTSVSVDRTRLSSRSPSSVLGLCSPGVSTMTSCASGRCTIPRIVRRVVCGRLLVIATLVPTSAFINVDLPTLGRPMKQANPDRNLSRTPLPITVTRQLSQYFRRTGPLRSPGGSLRDRSWCERGIASRSSGEARLRLRLPVRSRARVRGRGRPDDLCVGAQGRLRRGGRTLGGVSELNPEDAKIITLARSARARTGAAEGAAVRDET